MAVPLLNVDPGSRLHTHVASDVAHFSASHHKVPLVGRVVDQENGLATLRHYEGRLCSFPQLVLLHELLAFHTGEGIAELPDLVEPSALAFKALGNGILQFGAAIVAGALQMITRISFRLSEYDPCPTALALNLSRLFIGVAFT